MDEIVPHLPAVLSTFMGSLSSRSISSAVRMGQKLDPDEAMQLALVEASKGFAFVSPNPLVGCVILDAEDRLISFGHHHRYGGPHAEIDALEKLLNTAQGAAKDLQLLLKDCTVYVTLEPCAHEGKTSSCAKELAQYPIKKLIYGLQDPNPFVQGKGAAILKKAGIETKLFNEVSGNSAIQQSLEEICEAFLLNFRRQEIFISLKVASSLDGHLGLQTGESQWITGEKSRHVGHELRAAHDATLIGVNTFLQDNPSLSLRIQGLQKKNKVVVLDSTGRGLKEAFKDQKKWKLFQAENLETVFWVVDQKHFDSIKSLLSQKPHHLEVLCVEKTQDLKQVLELLYQHQLRSIYVEGGAAVLSSFLNQRKAHRLYLFQAPVLIGGGLGKSWSQALDIGKLSDKLLLKQVQRMALDQDLLITGVL